MIKIETNIKKSELEKALEQYGLMDLLKFVEEDNIDGLAEEIFSEEPLTHEETDVVKHADICYNLNRIFAQKNERYGNSFSKQFEEYGLTSSAIRLTDKLERFKTLITQPDIDVLDESIKDTLLDMANYAIMTVIEIEKKESRDK